MLLLIGLGNPGPENARNRHNIGFMAADAIAERYRFPAFRSRFQGLVSEAHIGGEKIMLLKPMTYMNRSGQSVGEALRYFKLDPDQLLVIHDELDLAFGKIKVKTGGGAAGHNGVRDIDAHLGTQDYRRLRLGIGHPGDRGRVTKHVLSDFGKEDMAAVESWLDAIVSCLPDLLRDDTPKFLNDLALAMGEAAPDKKGEAAPDKKDKAPPEDEPANKTGLAAAFEAALARLRGSG
ncbi:MAG: aminoacyl-tRNA hydrolase [Alphaproteobacteria bacterium]|nr:aminoacyl-tRNA hydrolase [Alphaproteobacteria bacterium]